MPFGYGIPFAFGLFYGVYDKEDNPVKLSEQFIQQMNNFLSSRELVELFLSGVVVDESLNLLAIQQYEAGSADFVSRAEKFRSDVNAFDERIHKRAYMGLLTASIFKELTTILEIYGKTFDDFLGLDQQKLMAFFELVPTLDVEIELVVERNELWNRNRKINKNDKADISFLSVAIPYCDVVVTEHFFAMSAINRQLDKKYKTVILENLQDLKDFLS